MLYPFTYHAPRQRGELLRMLAEHVGENTLLAGGTDLLVNIRLGLKKPARLVDLKRIPEHRQITFSATEGLMIGPAVTITQLIEDPIVRKKYPFLADAGSQLASYQLRNRATVIGNLCNASPCADMAPALLCLGARIVLSSITGSRTLPLPEFFVGVKKTLLRRDEYCERIIVPAKMSGAAGGYRKLKRVKGHDIGVLSVALSKQKGTMRIAVGSAAPTPILVRDLPVNAAPARACREAIEAISPIDDVRGSRDYRIHMTGVFVERLMREVKAR